MTKEFKNSKNAFAFEKLQKNSEKLYILGFWTIEKDNVSKNMVLKHTLSPLWPYYKENNFSKSLPKKKRTTINPNGPKAKTKKPKQSKRSFVAGKNLHCLVWKKPSKLEFYQEYKEKRKYQLPKNERIKDIVSSLYTYQILIELGKVWSLAGNENSYKEVPLLDADQSTFEKIRPVTFFEEKKLFVDSLIMCSCSVYYICNGDQLYVTGSNSDGRLGTGKYGGQEPMPVYVQDKVTKIFAGSHASNFFFITSQPDLLYACGNNKDGELGVGSANSKNGSPTAFKNFKGSKILTKSIVEFRTKLTIDQIQNKLFGEKSSITKEQTLSFLKWIYNDEISDIEKLEQIFNLLELTFPPSVDNTLEKDIAQLYQDDESKDFKILVKIDDQEEENEEEEDKEGKYEEIPVHKFILLSRSGLFRAMFDYVNEKDNTNKVQDYTNKSIESLKILIKYFYTNSIEMTADQDPELIVDELSDAVEYYQLNDQYNFESQLLKIKKQFELN
ncbi:btk-binding protein-related [Anaeramoeba flamelloides]|uniref:Btk-binding protein-related n=1 Tax=Anaeramoeba flamelloides TaxID=1746091 RepID=A0ABQ8Z3G3_9EUKA|nr:btk-binding protein-related [Anaeramoeba flamelloides]